MHFRIFTTTGCLFGIFRFMVLILIIMINAGYARAQLITSDSTATSITLNWTAPGDDGGSGTASEYDVRYSTTMIDNSNWNSAIQVSGEPSPQPAGSAETFIVEDLEPASTYYFAIKSADEVFNWSELSNVVSKSTANEQVPPATVTSLQITETSQNSVVLAWIAPGDDGDQGQASAYDVRFSNAPITDANWNLAQQATGEPSPAPAGSNESFTVDGLQSETQYFFAIKTADEVPNWSGLSNVVSAVTPDQTPPAAIDDLAAITGDDLGSIAISWTATGDDGLIGTAQSYIIRTNFAPITEENWSSSQIVSDPPTPLESGSPQDFIVEGLIPGQIYYLAVKSADEFNNISGISNLAFAEARPFGTNNIDDLAGLPDEYRLDQNYPNPFNPSTNIAFALPEPSYITLDIYDSIGRKVASLVSGYFDAGYYSLSWNGRRDDGISVSTGIYFYRLTAADFTKSKNMILVK